ncbi:Transcriptional regulator, TetR family [Labilithrix luteola]|uniref:Transcriptional regulator, TetR family n=1 Tax=Labilithrix luteola TaxID=1391654 RepID=A0A0K1Q3B9_9BACT|nr:Transcriptional regulator, TetR family [Labilithrix luteola]
MVFAFDPALSRAKHGERKQPLQARSQATVDAILEATLQVLDNVGLQKLTTTRVAERAGVSVGTLYQYFQDKASLVAALRELDRQRMLATLSAVTSAHRGRPVEEGIRAIITTTLAIKHSMRSYRLAFSEADRDALGPLVDVLLPLLPVKQAPMRAAMLLAALDGPVVYAAKHRPSLLNSTEFVDELCSIAMGYIERCKKQDRATKSASETSR